jgi:hypothetical protein
VKFKGRDFLLETKKGVDGMDPYYYPKTDAVIFREKRKIRRNEKWQRLNFTVVNKYP